MRFFSVLLGCYSLSNDLQLLRSGDSIDKHHDAPRYNFFSRRLSTATSVRGEYRCTEANIRTSEYSRSAAGCIDGHNFTCKDSNLDFF